MIYDHQTQSEIVKRGWETRRQNEAVEAGLIVGAPFADRQPTIDEKFMANRRFELACNEWLVARGHPRVDSAA